MVKEVRFIIPGKPYGKQRPRFSRSGDFVKTYTPKETINYENFVKFCYPRNERLEGGISVEIVGIFPIPKSVSKKQRALMLSGDIPYTKKCDCDNLAKSILDALNGIAYDDDSQVCDLYVSKRYGVEARVEVILKEISYKKVDKINLKAANS